MNTPNLPIGSLLRSFDTSQAVSILVPTIRSGKERRQNEIRLKNLISDAEAKLAAVGDDDAAAQLLEPARDVLGDSDAFRHPQDSVAIFLAPEVTLVENLPLTLPERVFVSRRFHITPILPVLDDHSGFYLLVVSSNEVRLFRGNRFGLIEQTPAALPDNLREALNIDEYVSTLQHHSTGGGASTAMFHGQGGSDLNVKKRDELLEFFRQLDTAVSDFLSGQSVPLVFAGVDYLFPIYHEVNSYPHLFEESVTGNFDGVEEDELHQQAWPLLETHFAKQDLQPLEDFGAHVHHDLASDGLQAIIRAATNGRVETLYVAEDETVPGRDDESNGQVHRGDFEDGEDLLNYAAIHVLRAGGRVRLIAQDQLPTDASCAALFRYTREAVAT